MCAAHLAQPDKATPCHPASNGKGRTASAARSAPIESRNEMAQPLDRQPIPPAHRNEPAPPRRPLVKERGNTAAPSFRAPGKPCHRPSQAAPSDRRPRQRQAIDNHLPGPIERPDARNPDQRRETPRNGQARSAPATTDPREPPRPCERGPCSANLRAHPIQLRATPAEERPAKR